MATFSHTKWLASCPALKKITESGHAIMESQREETAMFLTKEFMAKYYAMEGSIGQDSGLSALSLACCYMSGVNILPLYHFLATLLYCFQ